MTKYFAHGSMIRLADDADIKYATSLARGTYLVGVHPDFGFVLNSMQDMTTPSRLYGDIVARADRIIKTYEERPGNTGVLLSGLKGSGKTMLMRTLSQKMARRGHSTVLINDKHCGDAFNKFIQKIDQPCMIGFDEFEKTYGPIDRYNSGDTGAAQDAVLTLLDGVFTGKKLFVFTSNDPTRISKHMMNRPGRIFYHFQYLHLDDTIIREYVAETLKNQEHAQSVMYIAAMIDNFQFDMLQALVEEMNRYNEDARTASQFLNIRPESSAFVSFDVELTMNGQPVPKARTRGAQNPLSSDGCRVSYPTDQKDPDGDVIWNNVFFSAEHLVKADNDIFHYTTVEEDITFNGTFTRRRVNPYAF
jgi:hypothetical protein